VIAKTMIIIISKKKKNSDNNKKRNRVAPENRGSSRRFEDKKL
jgi:hypothetical protein